MSYIDRNLLDNETILFRTKKHWIVFLPPLFWAIASIFCYSVNNPILHKMVFLPAVLMVVYLFNTLLLYFFSEFAITNIRIIMREGFFFRHVNDTRLSSIANVNVAQNLIGQALDYGTVYIQSFGGENDPFRDIDRPGKFKNMLQEQLYLLQKNK